MYFGAAVCRWTTVLLRPGRSRGHRISRITGVYRGASELPWRSYLWGRILARLRILLGRLRSFPALRENGPTKRAPRTDGDNPSGRADGRYKRATAARPRRGPKSLKLALPRDSHRPEYPRSLISLQ